MDPDDPAVWINRTDPSKSLVLGTMKVAAPDGALAVFGVDGKLRHLLKGPDRPNNVDVEYGLDIDGSPTDIAVLTERMGRRLRVYAIARDGSALRDISAGRMPILDGAADDEGAPMGIGLYRRPKDGAIFAIVSPEVRAQGNYLWQYRLRGRWHRAHQGLVGSPLRQLQRCRGDRGDRGRRRARLRLLRR